MLPLVNNVKVIKERAVRFPTSQQNRTMATCVLTFLMLLFCRRRSEIAVVAVSKFFMSPSNDVTQHPPLLRTGQTVKFKIQSLKFDFKVTRVQVRFLSINQILTRRFAMNDDTEKENRTNPMNVAKRRERERATDNTTTKEIQQ